MVVGNRVRIKQSQWDNLGEGDKFKGIEGNIFTIEEISLDETCAIKLSGIRCILEFSRFELVSIQIPQNLQFFW